MAAMLFVDVFSLRVLGGVPVTMLVLVWLVLLLVALRSFVRRPWVTLLAPVLDFVVWLVVAGMR